MTTACGSGPVKTAAPVGVGERETVDGGEADRAEPLPGIQVMHSGNVWS